MDKEVQQIPVFSTDFCIYLNGSLQFFKKTIHLLVFFSRNCQFTFSTIFESKCIALS